MATPIGEAEIEVDADTDPAERALREFSRDAQGRLRDIRGRFVSESRAINGSLDSISGRSGAVVGALDDLRSAALLLSPAIVPIAAAATSVAVSAGAAAVAVGVFGAAVAGQISSITEAAEAEQKYDDAVSEFGATSAKAAQAQLAYVRQVDKMPPATRTTAAALSSLKDQYQDWSDLLAADTMPVATKAFEALGGLFPKLTPLVKGTSVELDRFVTILAGGIASPGLDQTIGKFTEFSTGVLNRANDALIQFFRTLDTGAGRNAFSEFLDYARQNGPVVRSTVQSVVEALGNVARAAAEVGPGLLVVVSALAELVASVPPGVITALLQLSLAIKAVRIAVAGVAGVRAVMAGFAAQIVAMRTAAAAAPGPLAAAGAAIKALSLTAKVAIAGTGIGLLIIALSQIAVASQAAPVDVDKLTLSLAKLGETGKVTGVALSEFGADFGELNKLIGEVIDPSVAESINNWGKTITLGLLDGGAAAEEFAVKADSIDQALTGLVSGGKADLAAAALGNLLEKMDPARADKLRSSLDQYDTAVENMRFEQQLAAQSLGLFGQQAALTSQKLDAQKKSADGLRQAIQALNDVNRAGVSAQIAFEQAIDDTSKSAQELTGVFTASGGQLDLNSEKGRKAATALNDLAAKTDAAAAAAREQGASWETVNGIYERGRQQLIKNAGQMGLNDAAVRKLTDSILKTPDKTAKLRGNIDDLEAKLKAAKGQLSKVPDSRRAQVRATIDQLEAQLASARRQLQGLPDARVGVSLFIRPTASDSNANGIPDLVEARARGGLVGGFPHGGRVSGPGTSTSDSILTRLSNGEFVMRAAAVRQYGLDFMNSLNAGRFGAPSASALGVGTTTGRQVVNVTYAPNITVTNEGVIGSQFEVENWLVRALDTAARMGRLPRSLTTATAGV